jgi:2-methylcitrate dehydratase PrpD
MAKIDPTGSFAQDFARFAIETRAFPAEAVNEGKRLLVDQLACQIACAPLPWSVAYRDAIASMGDGDGATVIYFGDRLPLDQAIFVNSAFGHGGEFDDTQLRSANHTGAVIVPAVLGVAENLKASGREMLEALIVGAETMIRVGAAGAPHVFNRHHHIPPATGPFGSAAAVSRLLGLSTDQCMNAIAIAGSHAGGHLEYTHTGGSVKRCHCAIPAVSGFRSTVFARNGITGPHSVFEGDRGFFKTFGGAFDADRLVGGLGETYLLPETAYKAVTNPYSAHGCLGAFDQIVREHDLKPDEVEAIEFETSEFIIRNVGTIREPTDILEAQFSLAFSCAVRLFRGGNGFYDYLEQDVGDPRFLDIARRVTMTEDQEADELRVRLNTRPARAKVRTKDGRNLEAYVLYPKGHPDNPLTNDELSAKFMHTVTPRIGEERAASILKTAWSVDALDDAGDLVRMTVHEGRT